MNIFKKIIIFLITAFYPFIVLGRELEADYSVYGLTLTYDSSLPEYVVYIYSFFLYSASAIVTLFFVIAGMRYLTSLGNPERLRNAQKHFFSVILGAIILISSFLILRTIHFPLVKPSIGELEPVPHVEPSEPDPYFVDIKYNPEAGSLHRIEKLLFEIKETSWQAKEIGKDLRDTASFCNCANLEPLCTYEY